MLHEFTEIKLTLSPLKYKKTSKKYKRLLWSKGVGVVINSWTACMKLWVPFLALGNWVWWPQTWIPWLRRWRSEEHRDHPQLNVKSEASPHNNRECLCCIQRDFQGLGPDRGQGGNEERTDTDRSTDRNPGLGGLNSLLEKLYHSGSSGCLLYTVGQRGRVVASSWIGRQSLWCTAESRRQV